MSGRGLQSSRDKLQWSLTNSPAAANSPATVTKPAIAGVIHVCTGIVLTLSAAGLGGTVGAVFGFWQLLDGANPLLQGYMEADSALPAMCIVVTGLNIPGTPGDAMQLTLPCDNAGNPGGNAVCNLIGYDL